MEANLSPSKKRKQLVLDLVATLIVLLLALLVVRGLGDVYKRQWYCRSGGSSGPP